MDCRFGRRRRFQRKMSKLIPLNSLEKIIRVWRSPELVAEMIGSMRRNIEPNHRPRIFFFHLLCFISNFFSFIAQIRLFLLSLFHCLCYWHFFYIQDLLLPPNEVLWASTPERCCREAVFHFHRGFRLPINMMII